MSIAEKPRRKRVFIATSQSDVGDVQKAMQRFDLDSITLEQGATPGTTWVDSLHRCIHDSDVVVGIMGDRRKDAKVFFELGVASALNKPTLVFIGPDYPFDLVPPSGIPYLRTDIRDEDALVFGLKQVMSLSSELRTDRGAGLQPTRPIGPLADRLLDRLPGASPREFEDLIFEAVQASGPSTIARETGAEDNGVDLVVWSSDLGPMIANPLLIECKSSLRTQADTDQVVGRMWRALGAIPDGCGVVVYRDVGLKPPSAPRSAPVLFVAAVDFLNGLRETGLAAYIRGLRGAAHRR